MHSHFGGTHKEKGRACPSAALDKLVPRNHLLSPGARPDVSDHSKSSSNANLTEAAMHAQTTIARQVELLASAGTSVCASFRHSRRSD